jgi:hypothetical protein
MPVLSAVLTLPDAEATLVALADKPEVPLGPPNGVRYPVVLSTETRQADKALWNWVQALPGVVHVELVFVDFSDLHAQEGT